jgi:hypothetical protein
VCSGISVSQSLILGSLIGDGESVSGLQRNNLSGLDLLSYMDCFVVGGSRVVEEVGLYLVISVGSKSSMIVS